MTTCAKIHPDNPRRTHGLVPPDEDELETSPLRSSAGTNYERHRGDAGGRAEPQKQQEVSVTADRATFVQPA